jgi:UDP-N-acetyl-D-glucosamine dehydrogenase
MGLLAAETVVSAIRKFEERSAQVGIIGLGYAGLPLACLFAESGFVTFGFDSDPAKIERLSNGASYIEHIAAERTAGLVAAGRLRPTSDFALLRQCDAAIICVPTPLAEGRVPDLSYVSSSARAVAEYLHAGQLVVLESTTYPGTTDEVLLAVLSQTGLKVGEDYFLAFSPEREDPANNDFRTRAIPKVIGGVTAQCLKVASAAYGAVVQRVVPVSAARVAEAAKLLENIFRCVNIAMVNELKLLFHRMDIDIWEVIEAAATKPFGFFPFYPGPGLGGHCIPIDPFYLSWKARQHGFATRFIELAGEINSAMPEYVTTRLADGLNLRGKALKDAQILLIGVAYKRNVDDVRESPALAIIQVLEAKLARVSYHDPHVPVLRSRHLDRERRSVPLTAETVSSADAVLIVTDHSKIDYKLIVENADLVIDTRNALACFPNSSGKIIKA